MKKGIVLFCLLFLISCPHLNAQVLDDGTASAPSSLEVEDVDDTLFDEMFSEFSETEKDVTLKKTFDDALNAGSTAPTGDYGGILPLNGDMQIGVTNGSFRIFQDVYGRTSCTFTVTLISHLDRGIKIMGLNLIYPKRNFAFVFKDIPENGTQVKTITTRGDICYNLSGVPDIRINKCRIFNASSGECTKRIVWNDTIANTEH
jgi:hypothetical protein